MFFFLFQLCRQSKSHFWWHSSAEWWCRLWQSGSAAEWRWWLRRLQLTRRWWRRVRRSWHRRRIWRRDWGRIWRWWYRWRVWLTKFWRWENLWLGSCLAVVDCLKNLFRMFFILMTWYVFMSDVCLFDPQYIQHIFNTLKVEQDSWYFTDFFKCLFFSVF